MTVTAVTTLKEFKEIIASEEPSVFDFWATWCGPCKAISPIFEKIAQNHPNIKFYKVDIEEAEDIAQDLKITAIPVFIAFKNSSRVDQVRGAVPVKLEEMIKSLA